VVPRSSACIRYPYNAMCCLLSDPDWTSHPRIAALRVLGSTRGLISPEHKFNFQFLDFALIRNAKAFWKMNHMRMLILLVVFAGWGCCVLCSDLPWTQGRNATVSVWSASRHTLSFEGGTWMTSSPTFVNCNATRFVDGELLVQSPTPALSNGTNPSLGPWT